MRVSGLSGLFRASERRTTTGKRTRSALPPSSVKGSRRRCVDGATNIALGLGLDYDTAASGAGCVRADVMSASKLEPDVLMVGKTSKS